MTTKPLNREAWLNRLAEMLRPWFRSKGYTIHGRISVGMATMKANRLGFCQYSKHATHADGMKHIFVSAYEDVHADAADVGATLVHELLHAVLPVGAGHGALFKAGMEALGLAGKATATHAGPVLRRHLETLVASLPPLPKYGITKPIKPKGEGGGKMGPFRFQCTECKTTLTIKFTSLDRAGPPPCWNLECELEGETMEEIIKVATAA